MARDDPHFRLRVPSALKESIEIAAKANNRSMNAEIVARLEASFGGDSAALLAAATEVERLQDEWRELIREWLERRASDPAEVQDIRNAYTAELNLMRRAYERQIDEIRLRAGQSEQPDDVTRKKFAERHDEMMGRLEMREKELIEAIKAVHGSDKK